MVGRSAPGKRSAPMQAGGWAALKEPWVVWALGGEAWLGVGIAQWRVDEPTGEDIAHKVILTAPPHVWVHYRSVRREGRKEREGRGKCSRVARRQGQSQGLLTGCWWHYQLSFPTRSSTGTLFLVSLWCVGVWTHTV